MDYRPKRKGGGVSLYIHSLLQYKPRKDLQLGGDVNFFLRRRFILYRKKQIDKKNTYILCKIYIHIQSILNT